MSVSNYPDDAESLKAMVVELAAVPCYDESQRRQRLTQQPVRQTSSLFDANQQLVYLSGADG